jgi:uncharacterized membrane protein
MTEMSRKTFGQVSWTEKLHLLLTAVTLREYFCFDHHSEPQGTSTTCTTAAVLVYSLATSPWSAANSKKPLMRVLTDSTSRHLGSSLNAHQIQHAMGTSFDNVVHFVQVAGAD